MIQNEFVELGEFESEREAALSVNERCRMENLPLANPEFEAQVKGLS